MNNTKMDDFKRALYLKKDTFSAEDAKSWTTIEEVNDCVDRLLDDERMMSPQNKFTFAERTLATRHNLLRALGEIMAEDAGKEGGYFDAAKTMFLDLARCSVQIRAEQK